MPDYEARRPGPGSLSSSGGSAGTEPGKATLVQSYPVHMARDVSPDGRLPPIKPGTRPTSMLSHLGPANLDADFDEALPVEVLAANALKHGMLGAAMELPHRAEVEARLGRPLPGVRCYAGAEGQEACAMVGARAFTVGNVIVFAEAAPPLELVLHEAVHCIQQGGDRADVGSSGALAMAAPGDASEREAHKVAGDAMSGGGSAKAGGPAPEISHTGPQLNGFFYLSGCSKQSDRPAEPAPTQISNAISDPPYGWTSKYEVVFTDTEIKLKVKVKFDRQTGVSKDDAKRVGERASASFAAYYDNKFVFTDTGNSKKFTLRCSAEFVDSGEHETVKLFAGGDANTGGNRVKWYVGWADMDYAHELGHHLGLKDEYIDAAAASRATATSPGVQTDNSLMGNYLTEGSAKAEVKLRHAQTIAGDIGGASGHSFTVAKK